MKEAVLYKAGYIQYLFLVIITAIIVWPIGGLTQNQVNFIHLDRIFQHTSRIESDEKGYLWVTDFEGIYKYDGYDFFLLPFGEIFGEQFKNRHEVVFKKDLKGNFWLATYNGNLAKLDKDGKSQVFTSFISGRITAIVAGNSEQVWFGTANGELYLYDYSLQKLEKIVSLPSQNGQLQEIISITFTHINQLWISTQSKNIYSYDLDHLFLKKLQTPFPVDVYDKLFLTADPNHRLWIATEYNGLLSYTPETGKFVQYDSSENTATPGLHTMFRAIHCDAEGIIWAGSDGDGLYRIDPNSGSVKIYRHQYENKFSLSSNTIRHINEDKHGNLWVVTKGGRINILPRNKYHIEYFSALPQNIPARVLSIYLSSDSSLWIGTDGMGLSRILPDGSRVHYDHNQGGKRFFPGRHVQRLVEDKRGNIWIGTYLDGLFVFDPKREVFTKIEVKKQIHEKQNNDFRHLHIDAKNRIWASSLSGFHLFNEQQELLATFPYGSAGLEGVISGYIHESKEGQMWIATYQGGLFKFHEDLHVLENSYFEAVKYYAADLKNSFNYSISQIEPDPQGYLWLRCLSRFLIRYNPENGTYTSFANHSRLQDIEVISLLIDQDSCLWLGSMDGLHRYDPRKDNLESYFFTDGLQGNLFIRRSAFKAADGKMYFGGANGVSAFYPGNMNKGKWNAQLYINKIEILNKPAADIIGDQIVSDIGNVKSLRLKASQSSFSFQFSAISDILRPDYSYTYRLKGFDEDWILPRTNRRVATYTNIPHGDYTFEVKASFGDGEWDIGPGVIAISIQPYWWQSKLAYAIYFLLAIKAIAGIWLWIRMRNRLIREEWQYNKEKEVYALKMNFVAKMSHEIQTPLTLILAPISDMLEKAEKGNQLLRQRLKLIKNNAERLSHIAAELTTIRNKELNKLKLCVTKNDLKADLEEIVLSFSEQARLKKIDFKLDLPNKEVRLWYDSIKLEHVFYNLLSNAFKLTPAGGEITLKLTIDTIKELAEVSVIDSGPGISNKELDRIFELFYQSEEGKKARGMGIGLALCKELMDLHHGKLSVLSDDSQGSHFTASLSTREDVFDESEKAVQQEVVEQGGLVLPEKEPIPTPEAHSTSGLPTQKQKKILIVEDNIEMQFFLNDLLNEYYTVVSVDNGEEAVKAAEKEVPDLIISDVMMPKMSGIEMSKHLSKQKSLAHIPIILLTAKTATESKLLGLRAGALSYMKKPFNPTELLLHVHNLLRRSESIIAQYKVRTSTDPRIEQQETKDEIFIKTFSATLNKHINDADFRLEELSNLMAMSYSVIYRRCQELTGKTPLEYFRILKLKKAATLIIEHGYRVSEAGYMVGYSDSKYFSKCFKEEFGTSPSMLKKKIQKSELNDFISKH